MPTGSVSRAASRPSRALEDFASYSHSTVGFCFPVALASSSPSMIQVARAGPTAAFSRILRRHLARGREVLDFSMNSQRLMSPLAIFAKACPLLARAFARALRILVVSLSPKICLTFYGIDLFADRHRKI